VAVLHDIWCLGCDEVTEDIVDVDAVPDCRCGSKRKVVFLQAPYTDVYGSEQWDPKNEIAFTSETDRRKKMKNLGPGFEPSPSADKYHGARNESHLHLGKKFSFSGQTRRS
jgi:hypothetical protein